MYGSLSGLTFPLSRLRLLAVSHVRRGEKVAMVRLRAVVVMLSTAGPAPFTATATPGGPGVGQLDLKVMNMDFPGTVEHGQIRLRS